MKTIHYPVKGRKLEETVTQETLDKLIATLENWQQGPGVFGRLNLHPCWGTASVLDRNYQGETIQVLSIQLRVIRRLYEKTKNPKWLMTANAIASHILYLQDASGAFIHSTGEFEPTFDTRGCPIHFFFPIIALCEYYEWPYADETIKALIPSAVERHYQYMIQNIWQIGCANPHKNYRPLPFPGWCGVTNQDLTATAALALSMKCFGRTKEYETYGKPVLDYYLSDEYYYEQIGLFERGDGINYTERTVYHNLVLECLQIIYSVTGEERLMQVYDNVASHLFDAVFVAENGLTYLARGAKTDMHDKSKVYGWEYGSIAFNGYPELLTHMQTYLTRHPDAQKQEMLERLKQTLAAYIFADGSIPLGIFNPNPLFTVAGNSDSGPWILYVMDLLGDDLKDPQPVAPLAIQRQHKNFTWKQKGALWAIEEDGVRKYGGFSRFAAGIAVGPEQQPVFGSFDQLEQIDILEIVE